MLGHESEESCAWSPTAAGAAVHLGEVLPAVSSGSGPNEMDTFDGQCVDEGRL